MLLKNIEFWKDWSTRKILLFYVHIKVVGQLFWTEMITWSHKKLADVISDTSKFKKLSADPKLLTEKQLQSFLRKLKNKQFFTKEVYDKIYPSCSKLASIYGLPKIHKLNVQRRNLSLHPFVSSINTYNYHFSKFLTDLLDPVIPTSHWTNDSFTFCEELKKANATNSFLISYDVSSLFTSIPLKETIDIHVNL